MRAPLRSFCAAAFPAPGPGVSSPYSKAPSLQGEGALHVTARDSSARSLPRGVAELDEQGGVAPGPSSTVPRQLAHGQEGSLWPRRVRRVRSAVPSTSRPPDAESPWALEVKGRGTRAASADHERSGARRRPPNGSRRTPFPADPRCYSFRRRAPSGNRWFVPAACLDTFLMSGRHRPGPSRRNPWHALHRPASAPDRCGS